MLDLLVPQFAGPPAGDRFVAAWAAARILVDAGGTPDPEAEVEDPNSDPNPTPGPVDPPATA